MATINASTNEKIIPIRKWAGLNEHPDGDTTLKVGEASVMKNFRVTRDGNLKRRPGLTKLFGMAYAYETVFADTPTQIYSGISQTTIYSDYSIDTDTGEFSFSASDSMGLVTAAEAQELLDNASEGQYYYLRRQSGINSEAYYRLYSASGMQWYGYRMSAVSTDAGTDSPVWIWTGYVGGSEQVIAACEGCVYALWNPSDEEFYDTKFLIGYIYEYVSGTKTDPASVCFLPFNGNLYILTNQNYYVWDGTHTAPPTQSGSTKTYGSYFKPVDGYVPLIAIALEPTTTVSGVTVNGSYELLESVNRLTASRRVWLSPDGTNTAFTLPESENIEVTYVKDLATDTDYTVTTDYTVNADADVVTFTSAPAEGTNTIEVCYVADVDDDLRAQVINNTRYELYSGKTDTVIFLYGNGTNAAIYSGMDYDGQPRADYFPDLNDIAIGDENTPITQLIRHNSALIAYKKDSAWGVQQSMITLSDDTITYAYYVSPINRAIGNEALGQVQLVNNDPITLFNHNIYRWVNSSYYSSNLTRDERQARRISDRVTVSCREFDFEDVVMYDDNDHQELYISNKTDMTLVWNYATDTWYLYDIGPTGFLNFHGTLYLCTGAGFVCEFDEDAESDNGDAIEAEWVSGAMDFSADYCRKYSSMLWVGLKPEDGTSVDVTVRTDRKNTFKDKVVPSSKAKVDGEPFMVKTKIKAKKFVYYRLIFESNEIAPPVTVTAADIRVRMTGYAK